MKKDEAEIILTDETREIVASYLAKRQRAKKPAAKKKVFPVYEPLKSKKK